jgi:hypothetical protein
MIHRRGFFGWLAAGIASLFGCKGNASKQQEHYGRLLEAMKASPSGKWPVDLWQLACEVCERMGIVRPNPHQDGKEFRETIIKEWEGSGLALIWAVPNRLGEPMEWYVLPTAMTVLCPALPPDYPDGYYRVNPALLPGVILSYSLGIPIPPERVRRISLLALVSEQDRERVGQWLCRSS